MWFLGCGAMYVKESLCFCGTYHVCFQGWGGIQARKHQKWTSWAKCMCENVTDIPRERGYCGCFVQIYFSWKLKRTNVSLLPNFCSLLLLIYMFKKQELLNNNIYFIENEQSNKTSVSDFLFHQLVCRQLRWYDIWQVWRSSFLQTNLL